MAILATDFIPLNRGGTPTDGSSGNYFVANVSDFLALTTITSMDAGNLIGNGTDGGALFTAADLQANETTTGFSQAATSGVITYTDEDGANHTANVISTDVGNIASIGSDGGLIVTQADIQGAETVTSLGYDAGTSMLTFTDEGGNDTVLDLSGLTTDIYVTGASINAGGIVTFTDNDAGTPDFTLDLSTYLNSVTDDQSSGEFTIASGGASTVIQKTSWMSAPLAP